MKMSLYGLSAKTFATVIFFFGMLMGMTMFYHYPEVSGIIVASVGGVLRGITAFLFGFEA